MGVVEEAAGDMDQEHGMRNTKICSPCYKRWSSISYNRTASKAEGFFLRFCLLQKLKENIVVNAKKSKTDITKTSFNDFFKSDQQKLLHLFCKVSFLSQFTMFNLIY